MNDKKIKIQLLADRLQNLLQLVDIFIDNLEDGDFELLEQTRESLINKINTNNGALPIIMAFGGTYDDTEDKAKVDTLDCLISMIKARKELRDYLLQAEKQKRKYARCIKYIWGDIDGRRYNNRNK